MTDFNKVLDPGDWQNGKVNTVAELSQGSILKIEYRRKTATFTVDRVEPLIFAKPVNYGFIPQTLDEDGDELDTLIVSPEPIPTGVWAECLIIGVMNFEDDGEMDHKIVVVPADNRDNDNGIKTLNDLGTRWKAKIEYHFNNYKDLYKPGSTKVLGWGDIDDAKKVIAESIERWNKEEKS
ncbi:MAG TPA: inorganic diphosphatase [Candidatus Saccharimonadales bacterium]|nr:inorganic diphosphatase [Candidatus Saccharimonadales bacterium]